MATKTEEFLTGTGTTIGFTTQYINESDIKVRVDGGTPLTFIGTTGTPTTGQYKIAANSTTITFGDNQNGKSLHIYSETDVSGPTVSFTPGSSIKAADLQSIETLVRHGIKESRNEIVTHDIRDSQVTSAKIVDGTIVDADINASAAIAQTKIATGTLPSGIQVASANIVDGSIVNADVSNSANIDGSKIADASIPVAKIASGTLPTNTKVVSANIEDGTILNADINASAAIAGTKIAPNFGSQVVQTTGNIVVGGTVDGRNVSTDGTKLDGIEAGATADQTNAEIKTAYEANADTNEFSDAEQTKLAGIETAATADQTAAEIKTLLQSDKLTNSEIATGTLDNRYYTETELDAGQLDNRYFTETELTSGALDGRYYTETEAEAKFLRQDSSETIASGVAWSNSDAFVATTAAINARIVDLIDDVGGFTAIASEQHFPNTNPQGSTGQAAILSIQAASTTLTPSGTTVTISNGNLANNANITITGVTSAIPTGFGFLVESTSTLHTYSFHRLVPKATEVTTVASNITNIVNAGANVVDINNFADIYQISGSAPTQRADGTSLQEGDLWFDSSNDNLLVYTGSAFSIITPSQSVLDDVAIVSGAITYSEDLGLITDAASTGSSNGSLDIVADALEDEITFTVTVSGGAFLIDGVSKPALTLYKGWTYTFDVSDSSNGSHPLRFQSGGSAYNTGVTVTGTQGSSGAKVQLVVPESQPTSFQYYCTNHSGMGNTITVKDDPIKTVSDNITNINTVASDLTEGTSEIDTVANNIANVNAVGTNIANVNAVNSNETNINSVKNNATNINTVAGSITNVNSVASNMANVNNFTEKYQISANDPSTDGGGNSLAAGDLYFNTSANELKVYTGSTWQGGVTATGNFATVTGNTFTGDNRYNDGVKALFGTGSDLEIYHSSNNTNIKNKTGNLTFMTTASGEYAARFIQNGAVELYHDNSKKFDTTTTGIAVTGLMSATTIDGAAGNNLQLDFGTL